MVQREFPGVTLVANQENVGFTRANNQGLRLLGIGAARRGAAGLPPEYVLLLNPDTEIVGEAPAALAAYLDDHTAVGIVGPELYYSDGSVQSSCRRFPDLWVAFAESTPVEWHWPRNPVSRRYRMDDTSPPEGPVDWITGAAMLIRTEALEEVGLFDEGFFMYSEELDLCRRFTMAGWEVHFTPRARILHHEAASSDQVAGLRHRRFHTSRARYFEKHNGRLAGLAVRCSCTALFGAEALLEAMKWLLGHKRELRRERIAAYRSVMAALWAKDDGA
jgi:GT2 family glycosyltransferase